MMLGLPCVLILGGGFGWLICYAFVVRRLRNHHNKTWMKLGSPSYMPALPVRTNYWSYALMDWIMCRDYLVIDDEELTRLAARCRVLYRSIFAALGVIAIDTVLGLVSLLQTRPR